jgi:outer membrane protein OmpA-like peptidoglycan-associated protein
MMASSMFLKLFCASILIASSWLSGCASSGANKEVGTATSDSAKRKAVSVKQVAEGALVSADERILFDTGMSVIKKDGHMFLDRIADIIKTKTNADISIEGHTDNVGDIRLNQNLSQQRAQAVRAALIKRGIDSKRLQAKGFGESKPVDSNETPDGRQNNRRTDIVLLGESAEKIGGQSLGDKLQQGLDSFLKNASQIISNVFGS